MSFEKPLLEYPEIEGASKEELERATRKLVNRYKAAVGCEMECTSICNQSLARALQKFDPNKGLSLAALYYVTASRLLMNAARDRNTPNRITVYVSLDYGAESYNTLWNPPTAEPLDLSTLTAEERELLESYYIDGKSMSALGRDKRWGLYNREISKNLLSIVNKIRESYGLPIVGQLVMNRGNAVTPKRAQKKRQFTLEELKGFAFLDEIERDAIREVDINGLSYVQAASVLGIKKNSLNHFRDKGLRKIRVNAKQEELAASW